MTNSKIGPDGYAHRECVTCRLEDQPKALLRRIMSHEGARHAGYVIGYSRGKYKLEDGCGFQWSARRADLTAPQGE